MNDPYSYLPSESFIAVSPLTLYESQLLRGCVEFVVFASEVELPAMEDEICVSGCLTAPRSYLVEDPADWTPAVAEVKLAVLIYYYPEDIGSYI
jgi:hypothetical protein